MLSSDAGGSRLLFLYLFAFSPLIDGAFAIFGNTIQLAGCEQVDRRSDNGINIESRYRLNIERM